jgi:hypothetical protein
MSDAVVDARSVVDVCPVVAVVAVVVVVVEFVGASIGRLLDVCDSYVAVCSSSVIVGDSIVSCVVASSGVIFYRRTDRLDCKRRPQGEGSLG